MNILVCISSVPDTTSKINFTDYEIIIVDNNSNDGSKEFIKKNYSSIKLIQLKENFGYAEPNNIGAKNAKGDFFVFLNNDTIVSSNFLSELICTADKYQDVAIFQVCPFPFLYLRIRDGRVVHEVNKRF